MKMEKRRRKFSIDFMSSGKEIKTIFISNWFEYFIGISVHFLGKEMKIIKLLCSFVCVFN